MRKNPRFHELAAQILLSFAHGLCFKKSGGEKKEESEEDDNDVRRL
jgi:hypothetical protein